MLEIGSGPGTDAVLLEQRGLKVLRSDATRAFADRLRASGADVLDLDVRRGPMPQGAAGAFANAVLLHLDVDEFEAALDRIRDALVPGGVLAFSVQEGDGEEWRTAKLDLPRRFTFWRPAPLRAVVEEVDLEVLEVRRSAGATDDRLQVIARRP